MKRLFAVLPVAVVLLNSVLCVMTQAQGIPPSGDRPTLADMTVTGKVTKTEMQTPDGSTIPRYILTDSGGNTVMLPWNHVWPGGEQATSVNLEDYVNKDVTIVGKGFQMERNGVKETCLVKITKIDVMSTTTTPQ